MYKDKIYELKQKRYKNFFLFYIIVVILIFSNYTFSKYTFLATSDSPTISIAQFNVKVNEQMLGENTEFNVTLNPSLSSSTVNTYNNKIAPNTERKIDIIIDPTETEVSLEYELQFFIDNTNINVTKYSVDDGKTFLTDVENNIVKGEILIKDKTRAFEESEKVKVSVYLKWEDSTDIYNPTFTDKDISVTCVVRQKIN